MASLLPFFAFCARASNMKWVYPHSKAAAPILVYFCLLLFAGIPLAAPPRLLALAQYQLCEIVALPHLYPLRRTKILQANPPAQIHAAGAIVLPYFFLAPAI